MIPNYIMQDNGFTTIIDGKPYMVGNDHPQYDKLFQCVMNGDDQTFLENFTVESSVKFHFKGTNVVVEDGQVLFDGEAVHHTLVDKILEFVEKDVDAEHMVKFLVNLRANPSYNSREQLYNFLQHAGMPITDDGCFLAYKGVTSDLKDCHTNSIDNSPGNVVGMPRGDVDDNPDNHCSAGLHAGTFNYASTFGQRVVLVKINPKDCVSVPNDHNAEKLRTCRYEVVSEYLDDKIIDEPHVSHGDRLDLMTAHITSRYYDCQG